MQIFAESIQQLKSDDKGSEDDDECIITQLKTIFGRKKVIVQIILVSQYLLVYTYFHKNITTLLASWLRRPPWEWQTQVRILLSAWGLSGLGHTSDLKIDTPVATLSGTWRYRVSTGTGGPGVLILWLGEMKNWSVTSVLVWQQLQLSQKIRPWDTLACCWDVSNQQTTTHLYHFEMT